MYSFSRSSVVAKSRLELPSTHASERNCSWRLAALAVSRQGALRSGPVGSEVWIVGECPRTPTPGYALPAVRSPGS